MVQAGCTNVTDDGHTTDQDHARQKCIALGGNRSCYKKNRFINITYESTDIISGPCRLSWTARLRCPPTSQSWLGCRPGRLAFPSGSVDSRPGSRPSGVCPSPKNRCLRHRRRHRRTVHPCINTPWLCMMLHEKCLSRSWILFWSWEVLRKVVLLVLKKSRLLHHQ